METSTHSKHTSSTSIKNPSFIIKDAQTQPSANLFLAGTGAVGSTLLQKLNNTTSDGARFRLLGICNSRLACWNDRGVAIDKNLHAPGAKETNWDRLIDKLINHPQHNLIFVDATGSEEVARLYPTLFEAGIHVVTPSKLASTFEQSFFDKLQRLTKKHQAEFRYETTVGAGLPVISTLQNLIHSGDTITEISGVVSGTMTFIFNQLEKGIPFSKAVRKARELGYAEPDPRDDLSGEDVARKFLTLARTLGFKIEREELEVESLIPKGLVKVSKSAFLDQLKKYDSDWRKQVAIAQDQNKVLRYTGRLKNGEISIGIEAVDRASPIGQLQGTDNLIQIYSQYYNQTPLVIQGPGAGKEVTAAGVLADIIEIVDKLHRQTPSSAKGDKTVTNS